MKRMILVFLLLCGVGFGADRRTLVVGGQGTGADAADTNGGGYVQFETSPGGEAAWTTFQGANGAALLVNAASTISDNGGGLVRLTSAGNFSAALVGAVANITFTDTITYTNGRYEITAIDTNFIDLNLTFAAPSDVNANVVGVGGALATYLTADASIVDYGQIKVSQGPYTAEEVAGSVFYMLFVSTDYETSIRVDGVDNATGEVDLANKIIIDGGDAITTAFRISNLVGEPQSPTVNNFEIKNATGFGVGNPSGGSPDNVTVSNCDVHDNGTFGIITDTPSSVIGCKVYNNGTTLSHHGVSVGENGIVANCEIFNNTGHGVNSDSDFSCYNSKIYSNGGMGIFSDDLLNAFGCKIYSNGTTAAHHGIGMDNTGNIHDCQIYDNAGFGVDGDGAVNVLDCEVYGNEGGYQIYINYGNVYKCVAHHTSGNLVRTGEQNPQNTILANNTLDGLDKANAVVGWEAAEIIASSSPIVFENNIVERCGLAVERGFDAGLPVAINGNTFFDNTVDVDDDFVGFLNIADDPQLDADYRPSVLIDSYDWLSSQGLQSILGAGALPVQDSGGGGGLRGRYNGGGR